MANPAFRAAGAAYDISNSNSVQPAYPASVVADELLIVFISTRDAGTTVTSWDTGWAIVPGDGHVGASGDPNLIVGYKVATGSESGSASFTLSANQNGVARMVAYNGDIDTADPFDADAVGAVMSPSGANVPVHNVTTSTDNALIVVAVGGDEEATDADQFTGWPASLTERFEAESGTSNIFLGVADVTLATAGEFNPSDGTVTATSDSWASLTFAIKPAAGGGSPQTVNPTGLGSASSFGTVSADSNINVAVSGLGSASAFGSPSIAVGNVDVSATGLSSASAFGSPTIATGNTNIAVSGLASASAFGTPDVSTSGGSQDEPVTGLGSASAFGTPTAVPGGVTVSVSGLASASAFGTAGAQPGNVLVSATGLDSAQAFGTPSIATGPTTVQVSALGTAQEFGSPSISGGEAPVDISSGRRTRWRRRLES